MKVLLTGATGYLGSAVLNALRSDGVDVVAQVRGPDRAASLPDGVEAVIGELTDAAWLRERVAKVDGVVHNASPNDATSGDFDTAFLHAILPALAGSDRPLVHTGGTWIHGSGEAINEATPADPPPIVAWRPPVMKRLRAAAADGIRTVVVAPANLYGAGGGIPALLLNGPVDDSAKPALLQVGGAQHFANVHRDDIARLYAIALHNAPPGSYYLGANAERPTMAEIATAASQARGLGGRTVPEPETASRERLGPLLDALMLNAQIDCTRARQLGWRPTSPSLIDEITAGSYAG